MHLSFNRYMWLMVNLSGPFYSTDLFFTVTGTWILKWISKSTKHEFVLLYYWKIVFALNLTLVPTIRIHLKKKCQIATASSASASVQRMFYVWMMGLEESPWGSFCRDTLNHSIPCQPSSTLFIASIIRDFVFI